MLLWNLNQKWFSYYLQVPPNNCKYIVSVNKIHTTHFDLRLNVAPLLSQCGLHLSVLCISISNLFMTLNQLIIYLLRYKIKFKASKFSVFVCYLCSLSGHLVDNSHWVVNTNKSNWFFFFFKPPAPRFKTNFYISKYRLQPAHKSHHMQCFLNIFFLHCLSSFRSTQHSSLWSTLMGKINKSTVVYEEQ